MEIRRRKKQEAKKWNGPYIPEEKKTKRKYRKDWLQDNLIVHNVPDFMIISSKGIVIEYIGAYWIVIFDKEFWDGGYGSEAYQLWIDFLFRTTDLHKLGMSTWSGNIRMMKVAGVSFKDRGYQSI